MRAPTSGEQTIKPDVFIEAKRLARIDLSGKTVTLVPSPAGSVVISPSSGVSNVANGVAMSARVVAVRLEHLDQAAGVSEVFDSYVEAAVKAGLDVDSFASHLSFFFACHNNFFEEVAKFRAARRLWASLMRERFGARKPQSWMLRFHTQTAGVTLTAQQPENNIIRVAVQALAAVLGGTQSLHTNSRDEALGLPTEESARIALRTQQVIAYESGAADVVDPLGGSYYLEKLTDQLEEEARQYLARIDALGGTLRAIEMGYIQKEIQESAYREQRQIERRAKIVVGLNEYEITEKVKTPIFRVDSRIEEERRRALEDLRRRRDSRSVERALAALDAAARQDVNLLPSILAAVKAYATIGEICRVLRQVFGEHQEVVTV